MLEKLNITIETRQDIIDNMENIRNMLEDTTYMTYSMEDIRARKKCNSKAYIDAAPRENFDDIFDAIDNFVYFNNRRND